MVTKAEAYIGKTIKTGSFCVVLGFGNREAEHGGNSC